MFREESAADRGKAAAKKMLPLQLSDLSALGCLFTLLLLPGTLLGAIIFQLTLTALIDWLGWDQASWHETFKAMADTTAWLVVVLLVAPTWKATDWLLRRVGLSLVRKR